MAKDVLRIALNAAQFPFLYRDAPRSAILTGIDPNVRYQSYTGGPDSIDWEVPQLLYGENIMPIARGYISTQIAPIIAAKDPAVTDFDQAIILRDSEENNTLFVPGDGKNYVFDASAGTWGTSLTFSPAGKLVTRAYVQGRTFVCYEKEKIFEYDGSTGAMVDRTGSIVFPAGFTISDIRGIGGASNYHILFTEIDVLWSSPSDPLNFNRALNNGSGFQIPEDLRGQISCILPVSGGAIIYTVRNAVAAVFTNNAATPFVFRGISNSGGVASYEQVAYDADEQYQYVFGSGGMQKVSLRIAEGVFPELTDFLTSSLYETYSYADHLVTSTQLGSYLSVKLTYVSQRFLVISYGPTAQTYTYALIFDTVLQRWGKVKKDHVDAFTYPYPNILGDLTYAELHADIASLGDSSITDLGIGVLSISPPKKSIAFLGAGGTVDILAIDYRLRGAVATAILGYIQHNRNRMTTLHNVELEGIDASSLTPAVYDLISVNGKDVARVEALTVVENSMNFRQYNGDHCGKNHQLAIEGAFQLTNCIVQVAKHGRA